MATENRVWKQGAAWAASRLDVEGKSEFLGHFRFKSEATKATEHSGHEIEVVKFRAGGYPIAGWNWPMWGYRVVCSCGYRTMNVAGNTAAYVKDHLERS